MSNENAEMERGIAQVLYNFAPGQLFDYGRHGVTMNVSRWETETVEGIDAGRIADHIAGRVGSFANSHERPWSEIRSANLDFFRPLRVYGEFFPLTAVCKRCDTVTYRNTPKGLSYTNGRCSRDGCGGQLQQVPLVLTHECGGLTDLRPDGCPNHGLDAIELQKGSPDDMRTWHFVCGLCDHTETLGGNCSQCGEYVSTATPLGSGSVFYGQHDTLVDIPPVGVDDGEIPYGQDWARILMAAHLGDVNLGEDGVTLESIATTEMTEDDQYQEAVEKYGEENEEMIRDLLSMSGPDRSSVVEANKKNIQLPTQGTSQEPEGYSVIQHELFTFLRATKGYEGPAAKVADADRHPVPRNLSEFIDDPEFVENYPQAKQYREKLNRIHVEDAWVVDNFPLLNIVFGYTRGSPDASETRLQKFDHPKAKDAIPVYCDRSPSEAIILEIDRGAIIDWLVENGWLNEDESPDMDDDRALKTWFLENIDTTETQNPFEEIDDETTRLVYTLIHSMSHSLMATASEQCGLASDSISELIFPSVPAIVLYAQSMEHFALGGMFTLFKTRIHPWVDTAIDHAERCIYDPACSNDENGAACHACLHLSEFTCEYFNGALDRNMLVGHPERDIEPFWEL